MLWRLLPFIIIISIATTLIYEQNNDVVEGALLLNAMGLHVEIYYSICNGVVNNYRALSKISPPFTMIIGPKAVQLLLPTILSPSCMASWVVD